MRTPRIITFDIFGTVLDWRAGLIAACPEIDDAVFDRVVDCQGELEHGPFVTYADITARSLERVLGLPPARAADIAQTIGAWPLFEDAPLLRTLMRIAPCGAISNSDRAHGEAIQRRLGFRLNHWLCAEDTRLYKPDPGMWQAFAARSGVAPSKAWWHASAYADYDLETAQRLGLTTVFVSRPHARPGAADITVHGLEELIALVARPA